MSDDMFTEKQTCMVIKPTWYADDQVSQSVWVKLWTVWPWFLLGPRWASNSRRAVFGQAWNEQIWFAWPSGNSRSEADLLPSCVCGKYVHVAWSSLGHCIWPNISIPVNRLHSGLHEVRCDSGMKKNGFLHFNLKAICTTGILLSLGCISIFKLLQQQHFTAGFACLENRRPSGSLLLPRNCAAETLFFWHH